MGSDGAAGYGRPDRDSTGEQPTQFQFFPPLVVGLGTSGLRVLSAVRSLLKERAPALADLVVFLGIDADTVGKFYIAEDDFAYIGLQAGEGKALLKGIASGAFKEIAPWIDPGLTLDELAGNGSGTVRMAGRVQLYYRFEEFTRRFRQAQDRLLGTTNTVRAIHTAARRDIFVSSSVSVYVVSSLCGGTGAGIYYDVLGYLDNAYAAYNPNIKGYLFLPSVFEQFESEKGFDISRLQANAFSCIRELDHLLSPQSLRESPVRFEWPGHAGYTVLHPPLHRCYLIDRYNKDGKSLSGLDDACAMVANAIATEIGSPLAGHERSRAIDLIAHALSEADPFTGRERSYSALSIATVVKTPSVLEDSLWLTRLRRISDRLLSTDGTGAVSNNDSAQLDAFIRKIGMVESGTSEHLIQDALQQDDGRKRMLLITSFCVTAETARRMSNQKVKNEINQRTTLKDRYLSERRTDDALIEALDGRRAELLKRFTTAVKEETAQVLRNRGAGAASNFARRVKVYCDSAATQLDQTRAALVQHQHELEDRLHKTAIFRGRIMLMFGNETERVKAATLHNQIVDVDVGLAVRDRARAILADVARALKDQLEALSELELVGQQLQRRASKDHADILESLSNGSGLRRCTLEQEVLTEGDCKRAEADDSAATAVETLLDGATVLDGPLERTLRLPPGAVRMLDSTEAFQKLRKEWGPQLQTLVLKEDIVDLLSNRTTPASLTEVQATMEALIKLSSPFLRYSVIGNVRLAKPEILLFPDGAGRKKKLDRMLIGADDLLNSVPKTTIGTPYRFALTVIRQVHGLSAYHLNEWKTFEEAYFHWLGRERKLPVERALLGWRNAPVVPVLTAEAKACALAFAVGYVAKTGLNYVFRIGDDGGPYYESDLPIVDPVLHKRSSPLSTAAPHRREIVGATRWQVRNRFEDDPPLRVATMKAVESTFTKPMKDSLEAHVTNHVDSRIVAILDRDDADADDVREYFQLVEEAAAIRTFINQVSY